MKGNIIVLAPHPDDETLACGGTIARRLDEGYDVTVVFLTDGRNALTDLGVFSQPTPLELKEIRKEETRRATKILGLSDDDLIFLDIEDGRLNESEEIVSKRIAEILKEKRPKEIYFPQRKEYNVDHKSANRLVRKVINQLHYRLHAYEYLIAWSYPFNILSRVQPKSLYDLILSKLLNFNMARVDISDFIAIKKAAIHEYQSQLKIISPKQKKPVVGNCPLQRFWENEEVFFVFR